MFTPPLLQNMHQLDRSLFKKTIPLMALKVPVHRASNCLKLFANYLLNCPKQRNLVPKPDSSDTQFKLLLLNPRFSEISQLPEELIQDAFPEVSLDSIVYPYDLQLTYDYWSADEIFKSVFPAGTEIVTAIEMVGDIGHLNLREHLLPFKKLIGEVLLDKNPSLKTIINKTSQIETEFRTFPYDILATRIPDQHTSTSLITQVHQSQIYFSLDFAKVYWNSRLLNEHERIVQRIEPNSLVADVMCGIGPFALPLAKHRQCMVFANDLNPSCFQYLQTNLKKNNLQSWVIPFQMDAWDFIANTSLSQLQIHQRTWKETTLSSFKNRSDRKRFQKFQEFCASVPLLHFQHYIMNLPASALNFLGAFRGIYFPYKEMHRDYLENHLPWIHVYCFSHASMEELTKELKHQVESIFKASIDSIQVHQVRCVAPKKLMCCVSFQLPASVAFLDLTKISDQPQTKKLKSEEIESRNKVREE